MTRFCEIPVVIEADFAWRQVRIRVAGEMSMHADRMEADGYQGVIALEPDPSRT